MCTQIMHTSIFYSWHVWFIKKVHSYPWILNVRFMLHILYTRWASVQSFTLKSGICSSLSLQSATLPFKLKACVHPFRSTCTLEPKNYPNWKSNTPRNNRIVAFKSNTPKNNWIVAFQTAYPPRYSTPVLSSQNERYTALHIHN
jgi:hypothetical protein